MIPSESFTMLITFSGLSLLSFFGAHWIIRFDDVADVFADILGETRKFKEKFILLITPKPDKNG